MPNPIHLWRPTAAIILGLLVGAMPLASAASTSPPATTDHGFSSAFLGLPFVAYPDDQVLVVDFSEDPDSAAERLVAEQDTLDGWTVRVEGLATPTLEERREADAALTASDPKPSAGACRALPPLPRQAPYHPYRGCDVADDQALLPVVRDTGAAGLSQAVLEVLESRYPDVRIAAPEVSLTMGQAFVNFGHDFASVVDPWLAADGALLANALTLTALSSSDVDSITFMIDGDCRAFSLAVGGDACGTVSWRELEAMS